MAAEHTTTDTARFIVGGTYSCRSFCDYDCTWTFEVIKRTAKFVTLREDDGSTHRVGILEWGGSESVSPLGTYSMAPVLRAEHPAV